jgi:hypothetical protein
MNLLNTPLRPPGHLPLEGGDQLLSTVSPITNVAGLSMTRKLPFSPLEGEMAGRPEGGGNGAPATGATQ